MTKFLVSLLALGAAVVASCQPPLTTAPTTTAVPVPDEASARAAVRHIQARANATLYMPDPARVNDNEASWQVLVPAPTGPAAPASR